MSNAFDFELIADDRVSVTIQEINQAIKNLNPGLENTRESLRLGGDETTEDLDGIVDSLEKMARGARDNVQFIGDIIPPLKVVGELAGKVAGFGAASAIGFGISKVADGFRAAAKEAYNLETQAQNTAMSVRDFTQLSGAMRILGSDSASATASIEGIFKAFNEAASGKNAGVMAAMAQIGAQIERNSDGSVNTLKTLESIAEIFPTLRFDQQKSFSDAVGLTPDLLTLMREGANYKKILAKADKFGLTVDPEFNKEMSEANRQMNEMVAIWDGLKAQSSRKLGEFILSPASEDKDRKGRRWQDGLNEGLEYDGTKFYHGDRDKDIRWAALRDKEFKSGLSLSERADLTLNNPDPNSDVRKKLNARYGPLWQAHQLQNDLSASTSKKIPGNEKIPYQQNSAGNNNQYDDILNHAGKQYGVDPNLLKAIMHQESGGNSQAVSSAGAKGLMQIMPFNFPSTGITDWTDPRQNIMAGAKIMAENLKNSGGDIDLALRYYHGGYDQRRWGRVNDAYPGAVKKHYDRIISAESDNSQPSINNGQGVDGYNPKSILAPKKSDSTSNTVANNLARSLKDALADQPIKLEITMVNDKGERKVYNVENNGKITTPMNY